MKRVECVEGEKKLMNDRHFFGREVGGRKENVSMTLGHLFFITAISVSFCIHHHPQLQQHFTLHISSDILITASPFFHQDDKRRHCNDDSKAKIYESGEESIIDGSCMEEISIKILAAVAKQDLAQQHHQVCYQTQTGPSKFSYVVGMPDVDSASRHRRKNLDI